MSHKVFLFKEHVNNATFFKIFILFLMCMLVYVHLRSCADRSQGLQIFQKMELQMFMSHIGAGN